MWDFLVLVFKLLWAIICLIFNTYKQLTGIQNDIVAVLLGVSPIVASVLLFGYKKIAKLVR